MQRTSRCDHTNTVQYTLETTAQQHEVGKKIHPSSIQPYIQDSLTPLQPNPTHTRTRPLNIIRSIETIILPTHQFFKALLVFDNQALFIGKMQKTNKPETCADV